MSTEKIPATPAMLEYSGRSTTDASSDKEAQGDFDANNQVRTDAPTGYEPTEADQRLDKQVNRKLDFIVLPVLTLGWMFSALDKNNLGNALTAGFIEDTGFNPDAVSNAVSMQAVTIVLCPFLLVLARWMGVRNYLAITTFGFGACSIGTAFCKTMGTFYFVRMLQAILEACWLQLTAYYLSTMYPRYQFGVRMAVFTGLAQFAIAFGGLIAYGCFKIKNQALKGWQWLFVIEGAITLALALVTYIVLPRNVGTAWYLTSEEKVHATSRMERDSALYSQPESKGRRITWRDIREAAHWSKLLVIAANIPMASPVVAFYIFTPVLVQSFGFEGIQANLMTVTPFVAAFVGIVAFGRSSDYFRERTLHMIAALALSIIGLGVMVGSSNNTLRYVFLHICLGGAFAPGPLCFSWFSDNAPDEAVRSILFGLNGFAGIASVVAGQIYKAKYAPTFRHSLLATMGLTASAMVIYAFVRAYYMFVNAKRRKIIAQMTPEEIEEERLSTKRLGDRKVTFIRGY